MGNTIAHQLVYRDIMSEASECSPVASTQLGIELCSIPAYGLTLNSWASRKDLDTMMAPCGSEPERDPVGLLGTDCVPHFLFVASITFPEFQRADSNVLIDLQFLQ